MSSPSDTPATAPLNPGDESPAGTPGTAENICPDCGGSGQRGAGSCPTCGGSGKIIANVGDA